MDEVTIKTRKGEETDEARKSPINKSACQTGPNESNAAIESNSNNGPPEVAEESDGLNNSIEENVDNPSGEGHNEEETSDTSGKKDKSFNTTNFSAVERSWIIYFLGVARGQAYRNLNDLSVQVYKKLSALLEQHGHRVPSQRSVRMMWKSFVDTGTMAKPRGGGRPKLPPELKKKRKRSVRKKKSELENSDTLKAET